jgi:hypothetical protein
MYSVEQDFRLRLSEAKGLVELIKDIENGNVTSPNQINLPVLRSSVIINLYNIIESTITQTLTEFHNEINASDVCYDELSRHIKDLALIYFYKHKAKRADIHESIDVLHHTVNLVRGTGTFKVPYLKMIESYQLYSGNLDARSIRKVMGKYGIQISETYGGKLKGIKDGRNTLSHGNKSFEEFGRDIVVPMLEEYIIDVESFLDEVITEGKRFIDEKLYKQASAA